MPRSWCSPAVVSPVVLLALGACSADITTSPRAVPLVASGSSARLSAPVLPPNFRPNSQRYAVTGRKPSTGRSGTAAIESRALLGRDGTTLVEATTGSLDVATAAPGTIAKVQLKNLTDSTTRNYNGLASGGRWSAPLAQVGRGAMVQLQASVRSIDNKRTDVVTVQDTVWRRPDLEATNLHHPARVLQNTFAEISVTVREKNGDVGAAGNCVLTVDGATAAQATGIWVDKGDVVDCVFNVRLETVGTHQLAASVTGVTPGDWSMDNNSVTSSIEVVSPEVQLTGQAYFYAHDFTWQYARTGGYYGCDYYYYYCNYNETGSQAVRNLEISGWSTAAPVSHGSPMTFAFSRTTAGVTSSTTIQAQNYWWYSEDCGYGYDAATNTNVNYCRYPWYEGYIAMGVSQYSGHVQYYGSSDYGYFWSENYTWGQGPYAVGSDVAIDVRATDADGNAYRMTSTVALTTYDMGANESWCDYYYYGCYTYQRTGTQKNGWAGF